MNLTIDTFAWIEILRDTTRGRTARDMIRSADRNLTPAVVLAEIAHVCHRDGFSDGLIRAELQAIREASSVIPIDSSIAVGAAHALAELRTYARTHKLGPPGLGDGLVLATARREATSILTGDPHFQDLSETIWIGKSDD